MPAHPTQYQDEFTIAAWLRVGVLPTVHDAYIVAGTSDCSQGTVGFSIGIDKDSLAFFSRIDGSGLEGGAVSSSTAVSVNTWTHVAVTFRRNDAHALYVDGTLQDSVSTAGFPVPLPSPSVVTLGG